MPGPLLPDDLEEGPPPLDVLDLEGVHPGPWETGAERIRLLEFLWETDRGVQPVLYLERELLD
jgi:hypothetical protein